MLENKIIFRATTVGPLNITQDARIMIQRTVEGGWGWQGYIGRKETLIMPKGFTKVAYCMIEFTRDV